MSDEIFHYGVKGMKWGVKRNKAGGSSSTTDDKATKTERKLSLSDPRVKRAAIIGASVTAIAAAAFVASRFSEKDFDPSVVARGAEKVKEMLQEPTDLIYMSKPYRGAGVTKDGQERTGFAFISKGATKDFFQIFDKAGLNDDRNGNHIKKMTNGDLAVVFEDLLGRVDSSGRTIPHSVFIPKDKASGLNTVEDVLEKFGPDLEARYQAHLEERRRNST